MSNLMRIYNRGISPSSLFDTMLNDFFNDPFFTSSREVSGPGGAFRVDIRENGEAYIVDADLPGVPREAVSLDLNEGVLTIDVTRGEQEEEEQGGYIHRERRGVSMRRSMFLKDAAADGAAANLENGVLTVTVPKAVRQPKSSRIEIG
ncbi:MAG: Hsp20 family protein [Oscillospiraceae bacterium]|nr:Hsp20 family protein [Oscillospiraceae bacterium]